MELSSQEQLHCQRLQKIYDLQTNESKFYEDHFTNWRFSSEPHLLTFQQARIQAQQEKELLFTDMCSNAEDGEIVDCFIELADFRLMRCIFAHHLSPKERIIEIPFASDTYMLYFHL